MPWNHAYFGRVGGWGAGLRARVCGWLLSAAVGCGGATPPGATTPDSPALPELPATALAAMPADADVVAHVDLAAARDTEPMDLADGLLRRSCLDGPQFNLLWGGASELALALSPPESGGGWVLAVAGEPGAMDANRFFELVVRLVDGAHLAARTVEAGRLQGHRLGDITVAEVGPRLLLAAESARFTALASAYDDPEWQSFPSGPGLGEQPGMLQLWDRRGRLSEPLWKRLPGNLAASLRGAPLSVSASAGPDGLFGAVRSELTSPRAAEHLLAAVSEQVHRAPLMYRLMGLPPLHERIEGRLLSGSTVEFRLHVTRPEGGRLLKLLESQAARAVHAYCGALSALGEDR